jgi:hypothetical protein
MGLHGSCLCGGVRYEIVGPLGEVVNCHCSMCRKATGAAFRTRAAVATSDFHWRAGADLVVRYPSSAGEERTFCRVCGATLVTLFREQPDELGLALGTLDDDPGVRASAHLFVASKAPWFEIDDHLPCFAEGRIDPDAASQAGAGIDPEAHSDRRGIPEVTTFMRFTVRHQR